MDNLITSREAQKLAKIGSTAFYMAKRFNPKEFPREHIVFAGKITIQSIYIIKRM
ncbi:hypothetical protein P6141_000595 [Salmonella enterica]|nr:hypothetical protein [Salmonella enterica subsp. enterica serovar Monschaui]EKQ9064339.1 hypothetical protein [Salmonella enterica]